MLIIGSTSGYSSFSWKQADILQSSLGIVKPIPTRAKFSIYKSDSVEDI